MRGLVGLVALVQGVIVGVWIYQILADQRRPPNQRWLPRHRTLFIWLEGAVVAAGLVLAFRLGD